MAARAGALPRWASGVKDPQKRQKLQEIDEQSQACYTRIEEATKAIDDYLAAAEADGSPSVEIQDNESTVTHANALHAEAAKLKTYPIRVLFVDDERGNRVTFAQQFEPYFEVLTAASGEEALETLGRHKIDAVVADKRMPGMNGIELLAEVRRRHPKALRVLLTGYVNQEDTIAAINDAHIRWYVAKPWTEERIVEILRQSIVDGHEADIIG